MATDHDDIPVAHTPPGGYGSVVPPPELASCRGPIVAGAPDLRGTWKVVGVEVEGRPVTEHPVLGHVQRIEQCGDRRRADGVDLPRLHRPPRARLAGGPHA